MASGINDEYVTGLSDLVDKLQELPLSLGAKKNILVRAARAGGEPMRARMSEIAPSDTGYYREHFDIQVSDQRADGCTLKVGASRAAWRGNFNEYGTAFIPPQPTLRPAFDQKVSEAVAIIGYKIAEGIEKEMKKL